MNLFSKESQDTAGDSKTNKTKASVMKILIKEANLWQHLTRTKQEQSHIKNIKGA